MKRKTAKVIGCATELAALLIFCMPCSRAEEVNARTESQREVGAQAIKPSVYMAVQSWELANDAIVSPSAVDSISVDVQELVNRSSIEGVMANIVWAYLYEVRDKKMNLPKTSFTIDRADLSAMPFNVYFSKMVFGKKVGYLKCVSSPEGGEIFINGELRGRTTREFVLSTGSHKVRINVGQERCDTAVVIAEKELKELSCP